MASDLENAIHRIEKTTALLAQQTDSNTNQLARLLNIVTGNGDGRSHVLRLVALEQQSEIQRQQIAELLTRTAAIKSQQSAWRNQAIGISAIISLLIAGAALTITILQFINP